MAGTRKALDFLELVSPFLLCKINEAEANYGPDSPEHKALTLQYLKNPQESEISSNQRLRHYQSEVNIEFEGKTLRGVERLYQNTVLLEPTTVCAAHCRWCLRGEYPVKTLNTIEITHATRFFGSETVKDELTEVLITGGDPLMSKNLLGFTLGEIKRNAPNIKIIRVGTRVPFQDPRRIDDDLLEILKRYPEFRFEFGVNVNHPIEFWPESIEAIQKLQSTGVVVYSQHPLLKNVNDNIETLFKLYKLIRKNNIEAHYLFHAIPLRGMNHHRTSIKKGLELSYKLNSSGEFSGRSKPKFTVLSDIGKIVLYEGTILKKRKKDNAVLLKSGFKLTDRKKWNPAWKLPDDVKIDQEGYMLTWYLDGQD
jgi:lysine 2,3-aminomutase